MSYIQIVMKQKRN